MTLKIKNKLYLDNKKKDKTINDHSALIDKIRTEYSELYKENQNLKLAIQNYERYNNQQLDNYNNYNKRQKYIPKKSKRKRRYQKPYNSSSSKTEDEEIIVPRRKRRRQTKFIMMLMLITILMKLMHITYQRCQQKMMTMVMKSMIMKKRMLKL